MELEDEEQSLHDNYVHDSYDLAEGQQTLG